MVLRYFQFWCFFPLRFSLIEFLHILFSSFDFSKNKNFFCNLNLSYQIWMRQSCSGESPALKAAVMISTAGLDIISALLSLWLISTAGSDIISVKLITQVINKRLLISFYKWKKSNYFGLFKIIFRKLDFRTPQRSFLLLSF